MNLNKIKEKVRILKEYHSGLTAFEVLDNLKVITGFLDDSMGTNLPKGCYFKLDNIKFVLINPELDDIERNVVYAHELGHTLLHPNINTLRLEDYDKVFVTKLENEADTFTSEFLLDDNIFEEYKGYSIYEIANFMCIPDKLVMLKYNNLDKSKLENLEKFCDL